MAGSSGYDLTQLKGTGGAQSETVPFACGFDLTRIKRDTGVSAPGASVFATATRNAGHAFAIDFGAFNGRGMLQTKEWVRLTPVFTAASYTLAGYGTAGGKATVYGQSVVTYFDLYLDASNPDTHRPLYQDYLGVQVISGSSVLGSQDRFFVGGFNGHKGGQLMFDPSFCGTTTVNLLSSPDPALMRASASVPEPGTLAQAARGRRVGGLSSPTPYDELRYPGKFYPQAAPSRIATVAALFGLRPPALATSRILELGCGEGGHLVPIAAAYPEARRLGQHD